MVIELAKPYDEEEAKRMLQRAQYVPRPQAVQQQKDPLIEVAQAAGADVAGKVGTKGAEMAMGKLGSMFAPKAAASVATSLGAGAPAGALLAGPGSVAATGAGSALGAGAAGAGLTAGLAAAAPIALPLLIGAKMFGLFNSGGPVHANMGGLMGLDLGKFKGPLASMLLPQYKEHGGTTTGTGPLSNNKSVKMTIEYKN
tara:strand:+ start:316 stop:912 length:597 start_codon:yes stop_codon:yes gene_type:complete